jgi:hypothetical protein
MRPDPRPDDLLERCGRLFWRLNLAIAWTDGLGDDVQAKTCSRGGPAAWKAVKPFREQVGDENAAAGFFKERARKRNPVVTAAASGLDLVEYDGGRDELDRRHGIPTLPPTLGWQSRRGPHMAFKTPPGQNRRRSRSTPTASPSSRTATSSAPRRGGPNTTSSTS